MSDDQKERLDVFTVREAQREGAKPFWCKIGSAYTNKDGSLSVYLDALPLNGKLQIRKPPPQNERREW